MGFVKLDSAHSRSLSPCEELLINSVYADGIGRRDLWPSLAEQYTAAGELADAAACWLQALWDHDEPPVGWLELWVQSELDQLKFSSIDEALDTLLAENPSPSRLRILLALILWGGSRTPPTPAIVRRRERLLEFLRHIDEAPIRGYWLAATCLLRLGRQYSDDWTHYYDAALPRLAQTELSANLDLPRCLRGLADQNREQVLDRLHRLRAWVHSTLSDQECKKNGCYADLIISFGLARAGAHEMADQIASATESCLPQGDVPRWLAQAFKARMQSARQGNVARHQVLPESLFQTLRSFDRFDQYVVNKLRRFSRILEPVYVIDEYAAYLGGRPGDQAGRLFAEMDAMTSLSDGPELRAGLRRFVELFSDADPLVRSRALRFALAHALRTGSAFSYELLGRIARLLEGNTNEVELQLLGPAIDLAATLHQFTLVRIFAKHVREWLSRRFSAASRRQHDGAHRVGAEMRSSRVSSTRNGRRNPSPSSGVDRANRRRPLVPHGSAGNSRGCVSLSASPRYRARLGLCWRFSLCNSHHEFSAR
jgi:hypothetical protein